MSKHKIKFKDIIKGKKPVLVDFYATWCGPCKQLSPIVNSVKEEVRGKMVVMKIDVDKKKTISNKYKVRSLPTLAIFQNGKIVWRESGLKTKTQLMSVVNQYIDNSTDSSKSKEGSGSGLTSASGEVEKKGSWFSRLFK